MIVSVCRQLDWRPEKQGEARKRHEKVVIIRNMFHPSDFEVRTPTYIPTHAHPVGGGNLSGLCVGFYRKTH